MGGIFTILTSPLNEVMVKNAQSKDNLHSAGRSR
jgi:hypothetical protein